MKYKIVKRMLFVVVVVSTPLFSCKKFLTIDAPKDSLVQATIFKNDEVATSTITGIYSTLALSGYASGNAGSITSLCGLSADEFIGFNSLEEFYKNQLSSTNFNVNSLWQTLYKSIYTSNAIIEGLNEQNGVTPLVKMQLQGEALFIRAFSHFYLVNLFGAVPIQLSTDYRINQKAFRSPISQVYEQVIADLKAAENLLNDTYITTERIRPNKSAVYALLARTYLYLKDWGNAEKYSSLIISNVNTYHLVNLDDVFLKNSEEAIWQLMPTANTNSNDGNLFILTSAPLNISLDNHFAINGFEVNDKRQSSWIRTYVDPTGTYYYPFKYKVKSSTNVTEYSMVFRLAEQFLIRAEARLKQNNIAGAIDDIDAIRRRAGITLVKDTNPNISQEELLEFIQHERFVELFSEWGHRWFDLKRSGKANSVLTLIKQEWQPFDEYYPIPQSEINLNLNINQNEGY
nr:RagB/SusD family nutrient uptake outer membrane protein [Pedobacter panaciterrae]